MAITLRVVAGPQAGAAITVSPVLSIGSDGTSDVVLADAAVAPRHCQIRSAEGRITLTALAPTFVNGLPVTEQTITPGDAIQVGESVLLVRSPDASPLAPAEQVVVRESGAVKVRRCVDVEELLSRSQPRMASAEISALAQIGTALSSINGLAGLGRPLLELVLDALAADRGALLLLADQGGLSVLCGLNRNDKTPVDVDRSAIDRVLRHGMALVASTVTTPSAGRRAPPCVLITPLRAFDRVLGALYIETTRVTPATADEQLQFLMAVSGTAALALAHARQFEQVNADIVQQRAAIDRRHNMVGAAPAMHQLYQTIARVAPTETTVLIQGESGTGKELVARAIHRNSRRADRPFVAINCAAIPESLLESELFGHEKGAFTGALVQKRGRFEAAEGGTLLLDEISELPLTLQSKLLRTLQEREIERVGGSRPIKVDFRLLAATNQDLGEAVRGGRFRQDLFFRLNVIALRVPALRERREDVPLLAQFFVEKHARMPARRTASLAPEALSALTAYDWPGNVRELENVIERAIVLGADNVVHLDDLPESVVECCSSTDAMGSETFHAAVRAKKRELIVGAVERAHGNLTAAAKALGLHPNYLHRLIRVLQLRSEFEKGPAAAGGRHKPNPNR